MGRKPYSKKIHINIQPLFVLVLYHFIICTASHLIIKLKKSNSIAIIINTKIDFLFIFDKNVITITRFITKIKLKYGNESFLFE